MCSKIYGHSIIPRTSFRRRPESSVIYPLNRGGIWAPAFAGATNIATGPIDAFDPGSYGTLRVSLWLKFRLANLRAAASAGQVLQEGAA